MKAEQLEKIFYGAKEKQNKKSYGVKVPCKANLILSSWHIKAGSTSFCYPMGGQDNQILEERLAREPFQRIGDPDSIILPPSSKGVSLEQIKKSNHPCCLTI